MSENKRVRRTLKLKELATDPTTYQPRHSVLDAAHVATLEKALQDGRPLDRIDVWYDTEAQQYVVVDGHHRHAAYHKAKWTKGIPVIVHYCSREKARLLPLKENSKARLQMTSEERLDAAWKLVVLEAQRQRNEPKAKVVYSKSVIASHASVSPRTVANMRKVEKELIEKEGADCVMPDSWWLAQLELRGREREEYNEDERAAMIEQMTEKLDAQIGKALGDMNEKWVEAAAAVVWKRMGRKGLAYLQEEYGEYYDDLFAPCEEIPEDEDERPF